MDTKKVPVLIWFLAMLLGSVTTVAIIDALVGFTEERHTAHIKEQCDKHGAEYLEIGNEKLCVKAVL